jgi:ABC-type dipeptide/oligopeptide/nickel transport system permease component
MIPTLFGVTVVSFVIMQLAPGDPLQSRLGASGTVGQSSQNREQYLIQRRELKLDKPLLLNLRNYYSYTDEVRVIARWRGVSADALADELGRIAAKPESSEFATETMLLRGFGSKRIKLELLSGGEVPDRESLVSLASAVQGYAQIWCEHIGRNGVPAAIEILENDSAAKDLRIGAIRCLASMAPNPFAYTFPREPNVEEDARVAATWRLLWERSKSKYPATDPDRAKALEKKLADIAALPRGEMFKEIQKPQFSTDDIAFFASVVLGDAPREQNVAAAEFLRLYITERIVTDVPTAPSDELLKRVKDNWLAHYEASHAAYHLTPVQKAYALVGDTQYAHMVWRLVTFQFGNSTKKSREPVWQLLWSGFTVSAPIMFMSQLLIYLVAVPLGVAAAVNRGRFTDRAISLNLFALYSIPPYVAAMVMLLFLCYGKYLKIFPMMGLHSEGAQSFSTLRYLLDYAWHATLPVICLSLFSLAGLAMYGRGAMLDVLNQDYIRTATAKGLPRFLTIYKHGLRNALIPIITLFASFLPALLGGSVIIEVVFNINGLGLMGFRALQDKDVPTLMALIYVDAIVVMFSMLMSDVLYVLVDPRITFGGQGKSS